MNQSRKQEELIAEQELREQEQAAKEKEEPPQNSDIRQLIEEVCGIKVYEEQKQNMEDTMQELLEPTKRRTRIIESLQNFRVIHKKSSISLNNKSQISPVHAITPVLPTEEPEYSLSMGYEHLSTTPETELGEVTESSAKNLEPIPRDYEVTSEDKSECDVPVCEDSSTFDVCKDHSEILSDSSNDDISSDDDAFKDIEYVEASFPDLELVSLEEDNDVYQEDEEFDLEDILQIQDVILHEKLLSINCLIANIESLNDNPTPDCVLNSSFSILIFEESNNSLFYSDNSSPEFETFSDHMEGTKSDSTTTHANNSLLEYDSFCFKIEPDQERLTSVIMKDIFDDLTNDPLLEEVNLFLSLDNSIPPGIENINYDSEGDIHFLEDLLVVDFIPFPENESFDFAHQDDPSFPRHPPKPPDVEFFFDFEPNSEVVILDELNEDECFDPGGEIDVFENVKDDD
nr:hypothetical protein [Tanacetum cinerariifolium]